MLKRILYKTEYFFAAAALILGTILIFLTPPLQSPDEQWHFFRAYSVAQGDFVSKKLNNTAGNELPAELSDFSKIFPPRWSPNNVSGFEAVKNAANIRINPQNQIFTDQRQQALYSPAAYLPQSFGIFIANQFTDSVYWLLVSGKAFLLLFYVFLGFISIKSMPFLKEITALTLLMPMTLSLGASVSADGVLIAISVLFFAKILQYSFSGTQITKKQLFLMIFLAVLLALTKQSVLLSLFILFLPAKKLKIFKSEFLNSFSCLLIIIPAFAAAILWSKLIMNLYVPLHGANPTLQLSFILHNPLIYLHSLYLSAAVDIQSLFFGFIGILGYLNLFLPSWVYYFYLAALILNFLYSKTAQNAFKTEVYQRFILIFVVLLNFLVISTIIYLSWIKPCTSGIWDGLQSRYFIPLALPVYTFLFLHYQNSLKSPPKPFILALNAITLLVTYLSVIIMLIQKYYA